MSESILYKIYRKFLGRELKNRVQIKPFESFYLAGEQCKKNNYEHDDLLKVVFEKTKKCNTFHNKWINNRIQIQNILAIELALNQNENDVLRVVELGGALGATFSSIKNYFSKINFDWNIVETKAMAKKGNSYFKSNELTFWDDLDVCLNNIEVPHLFFAQGSIQYMPDPLKIIKTVKDRGIENIYLSRTISFNGKLPNFIYIQNTNLFDHGPGLPIEIKDVENTKISVPTHLISKFDYESCIGDDRILFRFLEEESTEIDVDGKKVDMFSVGYFARYKKIEKL